MSEARTGEEITVAPTLDARSKDGPRRMQGGAIVTARSLTAPHGHRYDGDTETFIAAPLSHGSNPNSNAAGRRREDDVNLVTAFAQNQRGELVETAYAHQLTGGGGKPGEGYAAARTPQGVRRLTPVECERLQGFPDGHTCICGGAHEYRTVLRAVWEAACAEGLSEREARGAIALCQQALLRAGLLTGGPREGSDAFARRWQEARTTALRTVGLRDVWADDQPHTASSQREPARQPTGERDGSLPPVSQPAPLAGGGILGTGGTADDHEPRSAHWAYCTLDGLTCACPDSPRYAALGDAVTVNVAAWIGHRLAVYA